MRITFCLKTDNYSGGNKVVAQYADCLARMGHFVTVLSRNEKYSFRQWARESMRAIRSNGTMPAFKNTRQKSHLDGMPHVCHIRVAHDGPFVESDFPDADVVVATWWETAKWIAPLSARKGRKGYFVQGHESTIEGMPSDEVESTLRLPLRTITVSNYLMQHLRVNHLRDDVIYVPNAIDSRHFNGPPRGRRDRPTVGFIYRGLESSRGFDLTLGAIHELRLSLPDLRAVGFGPIRPPRGRLPNFCDFRIHPEQSEIPYLYQSSDVFIHASRVEGFGLPILEAMACRTPVVSTHSGAAPELLDLGRGRVVNSVDASSLAHGAMELLNLNELQWQALAERAYEYAHRYTLDDAARCMESALKAIANID